MDQSVHHATGVWPPGLTRVPYWVYRDPDIARDEQTRIFEGPAWHYLCLEIDIPDTGDYRTTMMGAMPVVVARSEDGSVVAFENRCAHRGSLICLDDGGKVKDFQCVYHAWRYDLRGNLTSIAFRRGVNGKGGMPDDFDMSAHGPRKLRTAVLCGLVFGTLSDDAPPIEDYIGPDVMVRLRRVLHKKVEVLGRFTQQLPCNWKLYHGERARHLPRQPAAHVLHHVPHHPPEPGRRRDGRRERRRPCQHDAGAGGGAGRHLCRDAVGQSGPETAGPVVHDRGR